MKIYTLLLVGILLITLFSCQERNDTTYIETKTDLKIDIPIVTGSSSESKSNLNITKVYYSFSGTGSYSASSFASLDEDVYNIQSIRPENGSELSFSGINESDEIYTLELEWGYKTSGSEDYAMQAPINLLSFKYAIENGIFTLNMDDVLAQMLNEEINQNYAFKLIITGSSSFNINTVAKLEIPVTVESEALTTHFELF